MKFTLFHYVHCPFCVRVRMALGYLKLPFESVVVPYDDEETPVSLIGKKMLPIMKFGDEAINESLDIIARLDTSDILDIKNTKTSQEFEQFNKLLTKLGTNVHNLAMPYWIWTPEFTNSSRQYFQSKKEAKRGPFKDLVKNKDQFTREITQDLSEVSQEFQPFYRSEKFSIYDILLAAHLWGLYVVPEFQFPEKIHQYLQEVKNICNFDYHQDFWNS